MTFSKAIAVCNECECIGLNEIHFCKYKLFKSMCKKESNSLLFCPKYDESKQKFTFLFADSSVQNQNQVPLHIQIPSSKEGTWLWDVVFLL